MNKTIHKDGFIFEVDNTWEIFDYEKSAFYTNLCKSLQGKDLEENNIGTKCIDLILKGNKKIFLIEIKDFRGNIAGLRKRIKNENLLSDIALKVRDTIAGLYGAYKRNENELSNISNTIFQKEYEVYVIFLLEEDDSQIRKNSKQFKKKRKNYVTKLNQILKFLGMQCNVVCTMDYSEYDYGWKIRTMETTEA